MATGTHEAAGRGEPVGSVKIWDSANGKALLTIPCKNPFLGLAFLPHGKRLAVATGSDIEIHQAPVRD